MKFLARVECDKVRLYALKKGPRQMVSAASRLYRLDDSIMCKDIRSGDAIAFYGIDSTQPWCPEPVLVDPDITKALIDSAKLAGSKKTIWGNLTPGHLSQYLTAVIIAGALIYGFLVGGGF